MPEFKLNFWRIALQGITKGSVSATSISYALTIVLLPPIAGKLKKVLIRSMKIKMSENQLIALNRTNSILKNYSQGLLSEPKTLSSTVSLFTLAAMSTFAGAKMHMFDVTL